MKALVKFYTFVGLPKSVQSDQGSNFVWCFPTNNAGAGNQTI